MNLHLYLAAQPVRFLSNTIMELLSVCSQVCQFLILFSSLSLPLPPPVFSLFLPPYILSLFHLISSSIYLSPSSPLLPLFFTFTISFMIYVPILSLQFSRHYVKLL